YHAAVYHLSSTGDFEKLGPDTQTFSGGALGMAAASPMDAMLTTSGGVYHWDGTSWSPTQGSFPQLPASIRYCGDTVYAVGPAGSWYRGSPTSLTAQPALTGNDLYSLMCPNDQELWAAGDYSLYSRDGAASWVGRNSSTVNQAAWRAVWSPGQGEAWTF